jgi:hypothetical protein
MIPTGSERLEAQPPEIIARKIFVIGRKSSPHKEQRQQSSEMLDLKGDVEMVREHEKSI